MKSIRTIFGGPYHGRNLSEFRVGQTPTGNSVYLSPKAIANEEERHEVMPTCKAAANEEERYEVMPIYKMGVHVADATVHKIRHCRTGNQGNFTENFLQFLRSESVS